jgi:hypothetical protein
MELSTYIVRQMEGVRSLLGALLADISPAEWITAPAPGQNPIGFTAWHVPSIQDWALHTWMQDLVPVRSRPEWRGRGMMQSFLPIGMSVETACEVSFATDPASVLAYADVVLEAARDFLAALPPATFDELPPNRLHLADDRYHAPGYLAEIEDMYEQPYWRIFAGACTGHCRGHLGELELGLQLIRNP